MFTEQLIELHRGQGMDIHWRDSYTCPTEEQYKLMVKQSKFPVILAVVAKVVVCIYCVIFYYILVVRVFSLLLVCLCCLKTLNFNLNNALVSLLPKFYDLCCYDTWKWSVSCHHLLVQMILLLELVSNPKERVYLHSVMYTFFSF